MSRHPDNFTEEELLRISRPVDPSILPRGRDSDWIKSDDGKCCQGSLYVHKMHQLLQLYLLHHYLIVKLIK